MFAFRYADKTRKIPFCYNFLSKIFSNGLLLYFFEVFKLKETVTK